MKLALIVLVVLFNSCGCKQNVEVVPPVQETAETYVTTRVNGFDISLRNENGQCVLFFSKHEKPMSFQDGHISMDMEAPCNFIHLWGRDELQFYEYGKPWAPFKIFIIVGGSPDPEFPLRKDRFMPNGCGTRVQKILVYDDRIRVDYPAGNQSPPWCPSEPVDEVFFAT